MTGCGWGVDVLTVVGSVLLLAVFVFCARWITRFFYLGYWVHKEMYPHGRGVASCLDGFATRSEFHGLKEKIENKVDKPYWTDLWREWNRVVHKLRDDVDGILDRFAKMQAIMDAAEETSKAKKKGKP